MTDLLAARSQMAMSLGFHILFAIAGMAMPVLMVAADTLYRRTGKPVYLELSKRWTHGTALLFAVGAVSGTVLSFELGLLWPRFMELAGPVIGFPFSLEGFAFFLEAIFLGLYVYGRNRIPQIIHFLSGVIVALSGLASGVFVVAVNAWMNNPGGIVVVDGVITDVDLVQAFWSPAFATQAFHTATSAYSAIACLVLGIHAWCLLKVPKSEFHRSAIQIAFGLAVIAVPLQLLSGDLAAKHIAAEQPTKLAAAEGLFEGGRNIPISIGGLPDEATGETHYALKIPGVLSFLATGSFDGEVKGLNDFPRDEWPPVMVTHIAFQTMVGIGFAMMGLVGWGVLIRIRKRQLWEQPRFLKAAIIVGPLSLVAVEAGWVVTEVGRQPWIIRGVMRTADAVTPMPHLIVPFLVFTLLYLVLGFVVIALLKRHVFAAPTDSQSDESTS